MIEVLVRAMVERFESKGEIFLWNIGNKSKRDSVVLVYCENNEYKLNKYFHDTWHRWLPSSFASIDMYRVVHES